MSMSVEQRRQRLDEKQAFKRVSKLLRHDAVEDEVERRVNQHQNIHHVADMDVDVFEEGRGQSAHPRQDALREFCDDEAEDHRHQHHGGSVVFPLAVLVGDTGDGVEQSGAPLLGLAHRADQEGREDHEEEARRGFDDDSVHPEDYGADDFVVLHDLGVIHQIAGLVEEG